MQSLTLTQISNKWNGFSREERTALLNQYPLLKFMGMTEYNEIIIRGDQIDDAVFIGPIAKKFYHARELSQMGKLWRSAPRKKYLVFDLNGDYVNETTNRADAESFMTKSRILIWREM